MTNRNNTPFVFLLANGMTNGGVTTWAMTTCRRLTHKGKKALILAHEPDNTESQFVSQKSDNILQYKRIGNAGTRIPSQTELIQFAKFYSSLGGGTFFPNWSWGTWGSMAQLLSKGKHGIRIIGVAHADESHYYELMAHYEPIISKFITVSREIERQLRQSIPWRNSDIYHLPYPVTQEMQEPEVNSNKILLRIAYVGRIQQWQKRILDLKDFAHHLASKKGNYCIEVAGDGSHLNELREYFKSHRQTNVEIIFYGLIGSEEVQKLWRRADASISFSDFEGLSISMIEGMAAGCIPVVTDVSGVHETVKHGINGFIHRVGDVKAMATSMEDLLLNPAQLSAMGTAARCHIEEYHHPERYDEQLIAIAQEAWLQTERIWPRHKDIYPSSILDFSKPRNEMISLRGRIKLKALELLQSLRSSP
jgi:glycosyltransferase involved in cell wall biosynthesis